MVMSEIWIGAYEPMNLYRLDLNQETIRKLGDPLPVCCALVIEMVEAQHPVEIDRIAVQEQPAVSSDDVFV